LGFVGSAEVYPWEMSMSSQSYKRREIIEIMWINGSDNPADAITKADPNRALEKFINTNTFRVRVVGWLERK
jgi:hypothetical protein